jgi:Zinc knuckle
MANLPRDYEAVKVKYGSCLSQVNAGDFLKDIIDFWKRQRSEASKHEVAMNVNKKKGKKKDDKKEKPAEEKKEIVANTNDKDKNPNLNRDGKPKKIVDRAKVTCFNCGVRGHFASECPQKKKDKEDEGKNFFVMGYHGMKIDLGENQNCDGFGFEGFFDNFDAPLAETGFENTINLNDDICDDLFEGSVSDSFWSGDMGNWPPTVPTTAFHDKIEITFEDQEPTSKGVFDAPFAEPVPRAPELFVAVTTDKLEAGLICHATREIGGLEDWLLDSGASCHVTNSKHLLHDIESTSKNLTVGDGGVTVPECRGTLYIKTDEGLQIRLTNVYYASGFFKNILSLGKFMDKGARIKEDETDNNKMTLLSKKSGGRMVGYRSEVDGLFYVFGRRFDPRPSDNIYLARVVPKYTLEEAHRLYGHVNKACIIRTFKELGWKLSTNEMDPCGPCALAKAKAQGVPKAPAPRAETPGVRIYIDISGPYKKIKDTNRFWILMVDDYTRYKWTNIVEDKKAIGPYFERFVKAMKANNFPIKFLRCDNAGENKFYLKPICEAHGIEQEFTAPHTPQQNGVVERGFVTIRDRAKAMMIDARLEENWQVALWGEAIQHAPLLTNCFIAQGEAKSPFQLFYREDPRTLEALVEWGRVGFMSIRDKMIAKLDEKAIKMVMVGTATNSPYVQSPNQAHRSNEGHSLGRMAQSHVSNGKHGHV